MCWCQGAATRTGPSLPKTCIHPVPVLSLVPPKAEAATGPANRAAACASRPSPFQRHQAWLHYWLGCRRHRHPISPRTACHRRHLLVLPPVHIPPAHHPHTTTCKPSATESESQTPSHLTAAVGDIYISASSPTSPPSRHLHFPPHLHLHHVQPLRHRCGLRALQHL